MKKTAAAVLLILMLAVASALGGGIFVITDGIVTGYTGNGGAVMLPSEADGIAAWLMEGNKAVTSVTVPGSYASVPVGFCVGSGITEATVESGVSVLENSAFKGCSALVSASIPASVTVIEDEVFADCPLLTVYTPEGSTAAEYCRKNGIDCRSTSVTVQPKIYEVSPLSCAENSRITIKVTTNTAADAPVMKRGNEVLLTFGSYTDKDDVRTWTGEYTFAEAGSYDLTFVSGTAEKQLTLTVKEVTAAVTDVRFDGELESGTAAHFTAQTTAAVSALRMCDGTGKVLGSWTAYREDGDKRIWDGEAVLHVVGEYAVYFSGSRDGNTWSSNYPVTVVVAAFPTAVREVVFAGSVLMNRETTLRLTTTADAEYVAMYAENGDRVKVWNGGYAEKDGLRVWSVKYTFVTAGDRKLTFRASRDGVRYGDGITAVKTVQVLPKIDSTAFSSGVTVGRAAQITVKTSVSAKYLRMYAENGGTVKTWNTGYTDTDGVRTWRLEYTFVTAGDRKLSFRVSADGSEYLSEIKANVKVGNNLPSVSAANVPSAADVGNTVTMTVKTGTDAKYLSMSAENGAVVKTWSSGYKDNGGVRTWTLSYAFSGVGSRSITFRASADGKSWGNGVTASINVCPKVLQANMASVNTVGVNTVITVKTSTSAKYLNMYSEGGYRVASWTGGYKDAGNERTWTVKYAFSGCGNRTVSFRASQDNVVFGGAVPVKTTVCPSVKSASFASGCSVGESVGITVTTDKSAGYLMLCAENGAAVKTWKSGYTDSGSTRTWKISYTFTGAGSRKLTFRASADGKNYGSGCAASVNVTPAVGGASFAEGTKKGVPTVVTVKTSSAAKYVRMYAENGGVVKTWSGGYAVSGNTKVWTLSYTFVSGGRRTISFRASCDGTNWGSGMSTVVIVE